MKLRVFLPPHGISIDIVSLKVSLNHVIAYDTDVLCHVEISLQSVDPVQRLASLKQSPKPLFAVQLGKIQQNDPEGAFATRGVFCNIPRIYFRI